MAGSDPAAFASALGGQLNGDQILAPGPGHSSSDRSLSVKLSSNAVDGFVVHSFAGDDPMACRDHVRARVGISRQFKAATDPVTAIYVYKDPDGNPYLRVRRTQKKAFFQSHWEGRQWVNGKPTGSKIPYRLPELLAGKETPVFVVEGEKDADRLCQLGLNATTNSEGAGKWSPAMNQWFEGRVVYILPDNDAIGADHAEQVAQNLYGVAAEVRIVDLPDLPLKGDVSDWLANGGNVAQLDDLCLSAPIFDPAVPPSRPLGERDSGTASRTLRVDTLESLASAVFPKREALLKPIFPCKSLCMLFAQRGVGKTAVAHAAGYAIAGGGTFLRWSAERPHKVLLIDGEMPSELLQDRILTMRAGANHTLPAEDWFRIIAMDRQEMGVSLNLAHPDDQERIESYLEDAEFLILDNISTLVSGGRENDADSWDSMQPWLLKLRRRGVSVLLVAHAGRSEHPRGTSKREDVLDTVIQLKRPEDYAAEQGARFEVHITKGRSVFGPDAAPFEATLENVGGSDAWTWQGISNRRIDQVAALTGSGMSARAIEAETGISKSAVQRMQAKIKAEGDNVPTSQCPTVPLT